MEPDIGLEKTERIVSCLNATLADLYVLTTKTKKFHWNMTGGRFYELHRFFEEHYNKLDGYVDEIAERITTIGGQAIGTLDEFQKASQLEERPEEMPDEDGMLEELLGDHESIVKSIRKNIEIADERKDQGTEDLFVELLRFHEKTAWMLRSFLD